MSGSISCVSCAKPIAARTARCPHCGQIQKELGLASAKVTPEEAMALLAVAESGADDLDEVSPYGLVGSLFMPHPATHGAHRAAELCLTVIGLPAILGSMALLALMPKAYRKFRAAQPVGGAALMGFIGGLGLYTALSLAGVSGAVALGMAAATGSALLVRHAVQRHAVRSRRPDLVGELEGPLQIPRAVASEMTPISRDEPDGEDLMNVPEQPQAPGDDDEPTFLT